MFETAKRPRRNNNIIQNKKDKCILLREMKNAKETAKRLGRNIFQMKYDNNENCPLCLKEMKNTKVQHTLCGHTFHSNCLEQQFTSKFNNNKKCALCRVDITDEEKLKPKRHPSTRHKNEYDFISRFTDLYSDLTDMYHDDVYKMNTEIAEKNFTQEDDIENIKIVKENILNCSSCLIKHLQTVNNTQEDQKTDDVSVEENDVDIDIEMLLLLVEKTQEKVLKAIEQTITIISNSYSYIGVEEFKYYANKNNEYNNYYKNKMILDIERINRRREEEREEKEREHEEERKEPFIYIIPNSRFDFENFERYMRTENDDEIKHDRTENVNEIKHDIEEDEFREILEESDVVQEERILENNEIIEREQDFVNNNNNGFYTDGNDTLLKGKYKEFKFSGYCQYRYTTGNSYCGNYEDGMLNGYGQYEYKNGNVYYGNFKNGKMDGSGSFKLANGIEYIGKYKDGKKDGPGTLYIPIGLTLADFS